AWRRLAGAYPVMTALSFSGLEPSAILDTRSLTHAQKLLSRKFKMPVTPPPTIIAPYEPVPNPNQGRTDFNANMQATFNRWPETSASQEEMGNWMEQTANQTEIWAGDAEQAVTDATNAGSAQVALAEAQVSLAEEQVTI